MRSRASDMPCEVLVARKCQLGHRWDRRFRVCSLNLIPRLGSTYHCSGFEGDLIDSVRRGCPGKFCCCCDVENAIKWQHLHRWCGHRHRDIGRSVETWIDEGGDQVALGTETVECCLARRDHGE